MVKWSNVVKVLIFRFCQFLDEFFKLCENSERVLSQILPKLLKLLLKLRGRSFFPSYFDQQAGVLKLS